MTQDISFRSPLDEMGFEFRPRDSATFARERHALQWLVEQVLVAGQPGVLGGPKKALKTSLAIDLAISVGSGTPFLGKFAVPEPARVAVLSGESGTATLQEAARRVCQARRINLADVDVLWQPERLPQLGDPGDRERLRRGLAEAGVRLVVIDPLYLCLLGGAGRAEASNLYQVGPLLLQAARASLDAGATPLLLHHSTKSAGKKAEAGEPPDLDDLAFAGIGEFARQWLLLGRRCAYEPGTGRHALTLAVGGSAGDSSVWWLDVSEGVLGPDNKGRRWDVRVSPPQPPAPEPAGAKRAATGRGKARSPWGD